MDYFLWNLKSELLSKGSLHLYWYTVLFILAFITSKYLLQKLLKNAISPRKADLFLILIIVISLISARLGFSILNSDKMQSAKWISWILPINMNPTVLFTGVREFSLPVGMFGLIFGLFVLGRKLLKTSYYRLIDIFMIISCLVGVFLFKANFIHSYFVGVPTNSPVGTVFMRPITDGIQNLKCCIMRNPDGPSPIETVTVKKGESNTSNELGNKTVVFKLVFKPEIEEREATEFIIGDVKTYLYEQNTFIKESGSEPVKYSLIKLPNGKISANITTIAIARHPTQLYFSIACLILFISFYWIIKRNNSKQGLLGGIILIVLSIIYFLIEFINLPIAESTKWQGLLANQWLSLLLALAGVSIFIISKIRSSDV